MGERETVQHRSVLCPVRPVIVPCKCVAVQVMNNFVPNPKFESFFTHFLNLK